MHFSIIYALYAISEDATENARVSENAMLVGLVDEAYHDAVQIQRYAQQLRNAVSKGQSLSDFIENELHRLRIEAYTHHYSCKTSSFSSSSSRRSGTNVYGIIRTFRSAPSEAILIVVPIKESHVDSISLALSFAKYTSQQTYWARNLIFLFVNAGSKLAAEAWIADYHGYSHPSFEPSGSDHFPHNVSDFGLPADGGAIIAAVAIDLVGTVFSQVEIQYGMINSRLPNMDLVAMFVSVIEKIGTRPVLYGFEHQRTSRNQIRYDYQTALKTIMTTIFYHV
jgi:hypothetical protein